MGCHTQVQRLDRSVRAATGAVLALTLVLLGPASAAFATGGHELWVASYGGNAYGKAIAASPDGSIVYVTGQRLRSGSYDYATVAYAAATGKSIWERFYSGPANAQDKPVAIAVSPDGDRVFVTGTSGDSHSGYAYATVAYGAGTGTPLWVAVRAGGRVDGLAVSPDGSRVYVTGSGNGGYDTVAYDAATGGEAWVGRHKASSSTGGSGALAVSPDGTRLYVAIEPYTPTRYDDYGTIAYDASTGTELWFRRYNRGEDVPSSLAVAPDGSRVFVTGHSCASSCDYATLAYDAVTGERVWKRLYDGPTHSDDEGHALAVAPDGSRVYVTGFSTGKTGYYDYLTLAYDAANGARVWSSRYNGPENMVDWPNAIAVSSDGRSVYVTGGSQRAEWPDTFDYVTVAYDAATGAKSWLRPYDGEGHEYDEAMALAVSPDATRVFVTGNATRSDGRYAYVTIAYSAN